MSAQKYLIALGSNQRHARLGAPYHVVANAFEALDECGRVLACSPIITSAPLGPSSRQYANAAAVLESDLTPDLLLTRLKMIEREFGRKDKGGRWRARMLDLDIILWSGGIYQSTALRIPHAEYRNRAFVLGPAVCIVPNWRDPHSGISMAQHFARLTRAQPITSAPLGGRALSSVGRATDF